MPAIALAAIASTAASAAATYAFGTAAAWASFSVATSFATSLILGGLAKALAKSPSNPAAGGSGNVFKAQGRDITVRQPISPWQWVVGEARVGGVMTYARISTDKKYLHVVVTLAAHECAAIEEIILGDEVITPDMINTDGVVISGRYGKYQSVARVHSAAIPTSPYQVTTTYDVDSVQSVTIADTYGDVESGQYTTNTPLTDVSPSSPASANQYSRSGNVFTFYSSRAAANVTINYTEQELHSGLRVKFSLGNEGTAQPFPDLVAESEGTWTALHRQTGHTKMYLRFLTEGLLNISGNLPAMSAVVRGLKVYDPRTATTVYRPNPALATSEYLCDDEIGTGAVYADEIEDATLQAAANLCEERVLVDGDSVYFTASASTDRLTLGLTPAGEPGRTPRTGDGVGLLTTATLPGGLSPGTVYYVIRNAAGLIQLATSYANACAGTAINITDAGSGLHRIYPYDQPRYTANGSFLSSERQGDIVEKFLGAMAGRAAQVSATWWIFAGGYEAPTVTLDESELAPGPVHIEPMPATNDSANGVKGVYVDTANNWQPTDFPALQSATYLSLDGSEEQWADLDLTGMVNDSATAQRLAKIELRRRRFALAWTMTFQLSAWRAMTARTIAMNFAKYGWTGGTQEFEVTNTKFVLIPGKNEKDPPSPGVEISARLSDSDIWDWSLSDLQLQAAVKNTSLPDPFTMTDPGVPTVTEELYETTGSAGVKTRALLEWSAGDFTSVARYEVRYKAVTDTAYTDVPPVTQPKAQVNDLAAGMYLFQVRAVNDIGVVSNWVTATKALAGLTAPPADVTGFTFIKSQGFGLAQLNKHPDLDVRIGGAIVIRYASATSGAAWEDTVIFEELPGDAVSGIVPLRTGTYFAKARDSSGNYSTNAVSFVATEGLIVSFTIAGTLTEHPGFSGTKSNVAVVNGGLQLDSVNTISQMTTLISTWPKISALGGVSGAGEYLFSAALDLTTVGTRRLEFDITAISFDTGDVISARLDPVSQWPTIGGGTVNDCDIQTWVRTTNDPPTGSPSPTWSEWKPIYVADETFRAVEAKATFVSGLATHNINASALKLTAKY